MNHPIDNIEWVDVDKIYMNDYNPNFVMDTEFNLLKFSIMKQGWIQPILVRSNPEGTYTIIDGYHRHYLTKHDKDVWAFTQGKVPCAVLDIPDYEAKMLTVRINRAKGVHSAVKMHELVSDLWNKHKLTIDQICKGIGATRDEVDLLLKENVFKRLDIENHNYSEAWTVEEKANYYDMRRSLKKQGKSPEEILEILGPPPTKEETKEKAKELKNRRESRQNKRNE